MLPGAGKGDESGLVPQDASRQDVFKSFQAIVNLADKSDGGKINMVVQGQASAGFDPTWLRNAVLEPLEEANIEGLQTE
jgi:hypothetical protein